jgi:uncharacterized protein (TIGR02246 family)
MEYVFINFAAWLLPPDFLNPSMPPKSALTAWLQFTRPAGSVAKLGPLGFTPTTSIMKAILFLPVAAGLLLLTGCRSAADSRSHRRLGVPQQEELRQASAEWDDLFNAGNAAKLALLYAEDAVSMPPNSPTVQGRSAIQADFESFFAVNVARHETIVDDILKEGTLAIEAARYRLTYKPRAGGTEIVESGRHLECRRKIDGKWKIVLEIWNSDTPASK